MRLVKGGDLSPEQKREVLRRWVHRTYDTTCVSEATRQFDDDKWLREHAFYVTKAGKISRAHHFAPPAYMADTK